jgi:hypothetical protein
MAAIVATILSIIAWSPLASARAVDSARCLAQLKSTIDAADFGLTVPRGSAFGPIIDRLVPRYGLPEGTKPFVEFYGLTIPKAAVYNSGIWKVSKYSVNQIHRNRTITILHNRRSETLFEIELIDEFTRDNSDAESKLSMSQQFDVDSSCKLNLFNTSISTFARSGSALLIGTQTFSGPHPMAGSAITKLTRTIPNDGPLLFYFEPALYLDSSDFISRYQEKKFYILSSSIETPIYPETIRPIQHSVKNPYLDVVQPLTGMEVTIDFLGAEVKMSVSKSADGAYIYMDWDGEQNWYLPKSDWLKGEMKRRDHGGELSIHFSKHLNTDAKVSKLLLQTDHPYVYKNLENYWNKVSSKHARSLKSFSTVLQSRDPVMYDQLTSDWPLSPMSQRPYATASALVQISTPEVLALRDEVLKESAASKNRIQISVAIAKVLSRHLAYNYAAIEDGGKIVEQSTTEILKSGVGTCGNFSNVFAAIARSMGIPTRIILGLSLDRENAVYHAWVEIESRDGVWIPFEPQSYTNSFDPSFYVPLAVYAHDSSHSQDLEKTWAMKIRPVVLKTAFKH